MRYRRNGVTVEDFDNEKSYDSKKRTGSKFGGDYPSEPAVEGAPNVKRMLKSKRGKKIRVRKES